MQVEWSSRRTIKPLGEKMRYAIFTDIDDTLYFDNKMNPRNVQAIKKARENGHLVFINTGRSTGIIHDELMHGLFDGVVASIGGEVYVGNETLVKEVFSTDELVSFAAEFLLENRTFVFEASVDSVYKSVKNKDEDIFSRLRDPKSYFTKPYIVGLPTEAQRKYIGEKYALFVHSWYFEFTRKGCNKATGMEKVLSYYGIPKERCIAIGDSINDIDMLKASGNPVCVDNAVDALKEISVYKTCHAKDGALYDCFSHFGLI